MLSGLIYAAIVVMWAVVLVPMWLRRHETGAETRQVDRFTTARRALSRRAVPSPDRRYVLVPQRTQPRHTVHVSGPAATARAGWLAVARRWPRRGDRRPERTRAELVARRRRNLLVAGSLALLTFVLAAAGTLPWLLQVLVDLVLVGYVYRLRSLARRQRAARRPAAGAAAPSSARPAAQRPVRRPVARRPVARPEPASRAATAVETPAAAPTGTDGWDPVPVPPPTYTLKPPAPAVPQPAESAAEITQPFTPFADEDEYTDLDEILDRRWAVGD